jgi:hypothetical protein
VAHARALKRVVLRQPNFRFRIVPNRNKSVDHQAPWQPAARSNPVAGLAVLADRDMSAWTLAGRRIQVRAPRPAVG